MWKETAKDVETEEIKLVSEQIEGIAKERSQSQEGKHLRKEFNFTY